MPSPAFHSPELPPHQGVDHTRRNLLIAAGSAVVLAGAGGVALGRKEGWWLQDSPENPPTWNSSAPTGGPEVSTDGLPGLPKEYDPAKRLDALTSGWRMPGAAYDTETGVMRINAGHHAIRLLGDQGYMANPPILRAGPRVKTGGGDFGIAVRMDDVNPDGNASVIFHAQPDIIKDEDRFRLPAIGVTAGQDTVTVSVWDGRTNEPRTVDWPRPADVKAVDFRIEQNGDQVTVVYHDHRETFDTQMFQQSGQVLFGANGTYDLRNLDVYPLRGGKAELRDTTTEKLPAIDPKGFQALAAQRRPDFTVGTALDLGPIDALRPVLGNFGGVKPEMLAKMQAVLPGTPDKDGNLRPEDFNWQEVDAFVELATRSGRRIDMHTLIFNEAYSEGTEIFLRACAEIGNKKAAATFMKQYITTFVKRYKDVVDTWDVVNEPLADTSEDNSAAVRKGAWYKAFGNSSYIGYACQVAKEAGAKRVRINENGCEADDDRLEALLDIAGPLARNGWVDAIGFQGHFDFGKDDDGENTGDIASYVNDETGKVDVSYVYDELRAVFQKCETRGLEADITELSIDVSGGHSQSRERIQAIVSAGVAEAAIDSPNVKSLYVWGPANGPFYMTTERDNTGKFILGNDAQWDWKDGKPVPTEAVAAIKAGLRGETGR